ncbi:lipopolysaccharide-induced tumor necrosis factor-alpha factor-like [Varroa jacobsoni]|uniref:LITAF domain-containing protein n=1 Tax=Varroa destructor TaxID=109461 RepID=A0A7M7K8C7_VARDE|nr:lipopolysaccharide-induced tumor necrosis factor-alpha factor-like [Varroa destructor]XP_022694212.1 lipopolysaccharide-induced tumor necrosis factor-alpha factor-like [Varroa jacobsoni]
MSKSGPSAAPNGGMSAPNAVPPAYPSLPVEPPPPYTPHASATPIYNPGYPQQPPPQFPQFGGAHPSQPTINVHVIHSRMGPLPQQVTCGKCGAHVMTATSARPGLLTYLFSGALIALGCVWGCCLIPYCIPECQDIEHHCPSCRAHLGTFKRL